MKATQTQSATPPDQCYIIIETQSNNGGYIPSLVFKGKTGHWPLTGRGEGSAAWTWGKTYEEAQAVCNEKNKKSFNVTPAEAEAMKICSMFGTWNKYSEIIAGLTR